MADFGDILAAFEENLILARELGARTIECDRSLLSPPQRRVEDNAPHQSPPPAATDVSKPVPPVESYATGGPRFVAATDVPKPVPPSASPIFLLVGKKMEKGTAEAVLFGNMISAMGCARSEFAFIETPDAPTRDAAESIARRAVDLGPKVVILFGSEAMKTFALAGCTARRGAWGVFRDIPAVATFHPKFLLDVWGRDEAALKKGKSEVWRVLKEALARVGRKPPKGK